MTTVRRVFFCLDFIFVFTTTDVRIRKALWEIYILICSSPEFPLYAHTLSLEIAALDINKLRSYISVKLTSILKIVIRPRKIYVFILQCHIQILDKKNYMKYH